MLHENTETEIRCVRCV